MGTVFRISSAVAVTWMLVGCSASDEASTRASLEAHDESREPDVADERRADPLDDSGTAAALVSAGEFGTRGPVGSSVALGPNGRIRSVYGLDYHGSLTDWLEEWGTMMSIDVATLRPAERCRRESTCLVQVASDGRPVFNSYVIGHTNERGVLLNVLSRVGTQREDWTRATTDAADAARLASTSGVPSEGEIERGYWIQEDGVCVPAWRAVTDDGTVLVDALTGDTLARQGLTEALDSREVYYADPGPAPLTLAEWNTHWTRIWDNDPAYSAALPWPGSSALLHTHIGQVRSFMAVRWNRDGWDDNTAGSFHRMRGASDVETAPTLLFGAWVSAGYPAHQAHWTYNLDVSGPLRAAMLVSPTGNCLDVISHEFFHGVEEQELGIPDLSEYEYRGLREGLSDMAGVVIEADTLPSPDWLMRSGGTCTSPIRSMTNPEAPASASGGSCSTCQYGTSHYSNFQRWSIDGTTSGSSGEFLYANAGIVDKLTHLAARPSASGAISFAGRSVTGIGYVGTANLLYDTVHYELGAGARFFDFAVGWQNAAASRFGYGSTNYYRAVSATQAVGLWTGSWVEPGITTANRTSFAPFTVSGEARTYVAYRQPGTNQLYIRYKAGNMWVGGAWSATSQQGWTGAGPALAPHGGSLWLFSRYDLNTNIYVRNMSSSGVWSSATTLPGSPQSDSDISAVEFGGSLYVFYKVAGSQAINYYIRTGGTWTGPIATNALSDSGPAATVVGNRLYLVYRRGTGITNLYYRTQPLPTSSAFGAEVQIPRQDTFYDAPAAAVGSPTVASYRGRLHVASRSADDNTRYSSFCDVTGSGSSCTYRPNEWTQTVRLRHQVASGDPVLYTDAGDAALGSPLYLLFPSAIGYAWDYKISE